MARSSRHNLHRSLVSSPAQADVNRSLLIVISIRALDPAFAVARIYTHQLACQATTVRAICSRNRPLNRWNSSPPKHPCCHCARAESGLKCAEADGQVSLQLKLYKGFDSSCLADSKVIYRSNHIWL